MGSDGGLSRKVHALEDPHEDFHESAHGKFASAHGRFSSAHVRTHSTTTRDRNLQFRGAVSTGGNPLDFLLFLQVLCVI